MPDEKFLMTLTDNELIHRAQKGDMAAFEQLVFRHDKKVLTLAARYVASADDAKDIYQEVFLNVYRGLRRFQFKSEFSTWLHRIAVNVCLTHRSRSRHSTQVRLNETVEGEIDENHPGMTSHASDDRPDQRALNSEIAAQLQEALRLLSPKQRIVFTLKHYEGYRLREIAAMMECTEGTVKRYLFDATARMRNQLKDLIS
jgi:RNA polymerase sigma-70 factor (ECF subfamily)